MDLALSICRRSSAGGNGRLRSGLDGHRIAEIRVAVGHPSAVEADEPWSARELCNGPELPLAGEDAEVPLMVSLAYMLFHVLPLKASLPQKVKRDIEGAGPAGETPQEAA